MESAEESRRLPQKRLLITAYHYNREFSMESRLSWHRAQQAAREYDVTVICARIDPADNPQAARDAEQRSVNVVRLPLNPIECRLMASRLSYYVGYRRWLRRVFAVAQEMHAATPFDLVHHMSFCGFREPGEGWRLGPPFVWGPIGGTHEFPMAYWRELDAVAAARELARNWLNRRQLQGSVRVRRAGRSATAVLAANRQAATELRPALGEAPPVLLETGVEPRSVARSGRKKPDEPLRILWSGRLQPWKGLSLLLKALAGLPAGVNYAVRVLGEGPSLRRWQRLAHKLGVASRVEWVGWPEYSGQLAFYDWADVFAFTSLRDTSGTGLLEALAAGVPIIGVDHQGAADIMTDACAIRVAVNTPTETIAGFRTGLLRIYEDPALLERLSRGALERSRAFTWDRHWAVMRQVYADAIIRRQPSTPPQSRVEHCAPADDAASPPKRRAQPEYAASALESVC